MNDRPLLSIGTEDASRESAVPSQFGRYTVVREIGKGGMACVYEGRHPQLGHRVALKVMNSVLAAQPLAATRFLREAKAAAQIRHDNVVEVYDIGTQDGVPFIVLEFIEGSNLAELLAERGAIPLPGLVNVFLPVISAISTAHQAGVIHRDLKPSNLMLAKHAPHGVHPVVLDFGISKIVSDEAESTVTRSESLLGTVQYMAPELTKGARFASMASDQYALGVMLYECATGKRPFSGESQYALMHAIVTSPIVAPTQLNPSLPLEFDALVLRAMHRDPAQRFPSVRALGVALLSLGDRAAWARWESEFVPKPGGDEEPWGAEKTLADEPGGAIVPASTARLLRRRRRTQWLIALLALYGLAATALLVTRPGTDSASAGFATPTLPTSSATTPAPPAETTALSVRGESAPLPPQPATEPLMTAPSASPAGGPTKPGLGTAQSRRQPRGATAPKTAAVSPTSDTTVPAPRSPVLGTNGAPIVE